MTQYSNHVFDADLELKAAGLVAASADTAILDLGDGYVEGTLVIDASAIEIATGDEIYTFSLEGSNVAGMATGSVALAKKVLGNLVVPMDAAASATGRYAVPFTNEENGVLFRYVRVSLLVAGTIATGINYAAFLAKK
jgi:hypothetical protein